MNAIRTFLLCGLLAATHVRAQTPASQLASPQAEQAVRAECVQGRRIICGRIVKVLPDGLVVDSGYTNLLRHPLDHSWLIPGTVETSRATDLVEKNEPDAVCVGLVFLTDTPKSRRTKPRLYDYVVLQAFPAGQITYNSVGTVERTVRRFSASLPNATRLNLKDPRSKLKSTTISAQ